MSIPPSGPGDGPVPRTGYAEPAALTPAPWHRAPMIAAIVYSAAMVAIAVAILVWTPG